MSKSQLSKQQNRRIQAAQERYRSESELGGESGLVIARFGKQVLIEEENGDRRTTTLRRRAEDPVAGDQVVWTPQGEHGVIEALLPRRTIISRPNSQGALRPIAANIDRLLIVIAPQPLAQANLIDRYLVAASHAGIDASLIVNKADLLSEAPSVVQLAETYSEVGC
jgi:ribosome biogenesis GTPase